MNKDELFRLKGQYTFEIQVLNAKLQQVDVELVKQTNEPPKEPVNES